MRVVATPMRARDDDGATTTTTTTTRDAIRRRRRRATRRRAADASRDDAGAAWRGATPTRSSLPLREDGDGGLRARGRVAGE